jgi:transcriptional regulator with XRE-family HTH domain
MSPANGKPTRREAISRFLSARRAAISPDAVGLPGGSRRRTPGLRREEVATLAGIGVTWYTWFEQGRDIHVSARALERIARALRMTPSDTEYLFSITGIPRAEPEPNSEDHVDAYVQDTLDGFQTGPAFFASPCWDVLAYNRLADAVFEYDGCDGPFARNHYWRFFMDPKRRAKYLDPKTLGEISVGQLRIMHGRMPDNAHFNDLIRELCAGSKEFRRLWETHHTALPLESVSIGMKLPRFGPLHFTSARFRTLYSQQLLIMLPPADERTAEAMRELAVEGRGSR